jgi:hypothetical protein
VEVLAGDPLAVAVIVRIGRRIRPATSQATTADTTMSPTPMALYCQTRVERVWWAISLRIADPAGSNVGTLTPGGGVGAPLLRFARTSS